MTEPLISVTVVLVIQLLGFSFWLGKLSQKVSSLCNDISNLRNDISELRTNELKDLNQRVSYIEGELRRQNPGNAGEREE